MHNASAQRAGCGRDRRGCARRRRTGAEQFVGSGSTGSAAIDEHGAMMDIRDSYGKAVLIENPAVRTYNKVAKEANATAGKLMQIWRGIKQ